jgi:hypothetical protein
MTKEMLKDNVGITDFIITIEETDTPTANSTGNLFESSRYPRKNIFASIDKTDSKSFKFAASNSQNSSKNKSYKVTLSKPANVDFKVTLSPAGGDTAYQAVIKADGPEKDTAVWSKYNPATKKIEARIRDAGTYMVKENKVSFNDVSGKSAEMQKAINLLASKSIIKGTSMTTFSPDSPINRAEITALVMRVISKINPNTDGKFTDVKKSDWFFSAVGSAKAKNIVNGKSATTFAPFDTISKVEIIAITARTLKSEMKYKDANNPDTYLNNYKDKKSLPDWCLKEVSLATRENLIVKRTDGNFNPNTNMTRGDAAIVLYRLFEKIW